MSNKKTRKYEIIITGATGFVGRRLQKQIIKHYPKDKILNLGEGVNLVNKLTIKNLPKNPKLIIHLAAETDTSKKDHRVNDIGLKNLYLALGNLDSKTHFIYIGTMINVAGRPSCTKPVNEKTKYYPTNEYTRTKVAGEKFLINKCKKDKFKLTILTPNTIYGKDVRSNSLFDILGKGIKNKSLAVRINWPGKSALIHVDDVVLAIIAFSKIKPTSGKPDKYLLYSENLSISEISRIMHKKMNVKYHPINIPNNIWSFLSLGRKYIPIFELLLPSNWYNQIWRVGIIVDDVVMAKSEKVQKKIRNWNPKRLKDCVEDVVN